MRAAGLFFHGVTKDQKNFVILSTEDMDYDNFDDDCLHGICVKSDDPSLLGKVDRWNVDDYELQDTLNPYSPLTTHEFDPDDQELEQCQWPFDNLVTLYDAYVAASEYVVVDLAGVSARELRDSIDRVAAGNKGSSVELNQVLADLELQRPTNQYLDLSTVFYRDEDAPQDPYGINVKQVREKWDDSQDIEYNKLVTKRDMRNLMSLDEWKEATESGMIMDHDGQGYYCKEIDGKIWRSRFDPFYGKAGDATHVLWFNK